MPNQFVWYELMTTDHVAAAAFYTDVVGWAAADSGMPGFDYTILSAGAAPVAGLMALPAEAAANGARPGWLGYVAVDDVDGFAGRVTSAGGVVHRPPADIPTVGRFAVVADPQGAPFVLFQPSGGGGAQPQQQSPGHTGWHELHAADLDTALAFYAGLFGWTKDDAIDMGPMGLYQMFKADGPAIGGMMTKMDPSARPGWLYYFNVPDIDAAVTRVNGGGGRVVHGPQEVPGGMWIIQGIDPQGAPFALVAPPRAPAS